jgi:hypothetical protein
MEQTPTGKGFDLDILRQLRKELPDLLGEEAKGEVGEQFGELVDQAATQPTLQVERELRKLMMEHDPLLQRWQELRAAPGAMTSRYSHSLFGEAREGVEIRYRCKADASHEFAEDEIKRDALNRPICPACGGELEPFLGGD